MKYCTTFVPYNNKGRIINCKTQNQPKMIENIKSLYTQIKGKTKFKIFAASYFGKAPTTINNHWLSTFWQIPEEHQEGMVTIMQNWIKNQK